MNFLLKTEDNEGSYGVLDEEKDVSSKAPHGRTQGSSGQTRGTKKREMIPDFRSGSIIEVLKNTHLRETPKIEPNNLKKSSHSGTTIRVINVVRGDSWKGNPWWIRGVLLNDPKHSVVYVHSSLVRKLQYEPDTKGTERSKENDSQKTKLPYIRPTKNIPDTNSTKSQGNKNKESNSTNVDSFTGLSLNGLAKVEIAKGCKECSYYAKNNMVKNWAYEFASKKLQDHINDGTVTIDEVFITAVKDFQKEHKLSQDGKIGESTISALIKETIGSDRYSEDAKKSITRVTLNETGGKNTSTTLEDWRFKTIQAYDRGWVSYGIIQFTLESGSLKEVLDTYVRLKGEADKKANIKKDEKLQKIKDYLAKWSTLKKQGEKHYIAYEKWRIEQYKKTGKKPKLSVKDAEALLVNYHPLKEFYEFLKKFDVDDEMKRAQYLGAEKLYYSKAVAYAAALGLQSKLPVICVVDAAVQHGTGGAKKIAKVAMQEYTVELSTGKKIKIDKGVVGSPKKDGGVLSEWEVALKFNQARKDNHNNKIVIARTNKLSKEIEKHIPNITSTKKKK